jgi:hypothetical protein
MNVPANRRMIRSIFIVCVNLCLDKADHHEYAQNTHNLNRNALSQLAPLDLTNLFIAWTCFVFPMTEPRISKRLQPELRRRYAHERPFSERFGNRR